MMIRICVVSILVLLSGQGNGQAHVEPHLIEDKISDLIVDPTAVHFIIVGDWGRNGQADQQQVADWMGVAANQVNAKFVISAGDNFYCCGVASTSDYQWISSFESVYRSHSLQIPWYSVLGNHDYQGNVQAQVDYTKVSQRWKMPARYFTKSIRDVRFVFIDTSPFIGEYHKQQYPDLHQQDTTKQLQWMDSVLMNSKEKLKIVVGHHPIYSLGEHGGEPDMQRMIQRRLIKNNVSVYIAGHDHNLQSLKEPGKNLLYLISGGGAEFTPVEPNADITRFTSASTGFMVGAITGRGLKIYFINNLGQLLYTESVPLITNDKDSEKKKQ